MKKNKGLMMESGPPGRVLVTHQDRTASIDRWRMANGLPPLPPPPRGRWEVSGVRGFLLLLLPPPKSSIEFWDDEDVAEVVWTPTKLGLLLGDLPYVRYFGRPEDGGWFDKETGEFPNRWLRERLEAGWNKARGLR